MSDIYDYRIPDEDIYDVTVRIDRLENRQLLKLKKSVEDIEQADESERLACAKNYFDATILPALKEFAEITSSLLIINDCDNRCAIVATIQNENGFEVTESCRVIRSLLVMANCIAVGSEEGEPALSLTFDFETFIA